VAASRAARGSDDTCPGEVGCPRAADPSQRGGGGAAVAASWGRSSGGDGERGLRRVRSLFSKIAPRIRRVPGREASDQVEDAASIWQVPVGPGSDLPGSIQAECHRSGAPGRVRTGSGKSLWNGSFRIAAGSVSRVAGSAGALRPRRQPRSAVGGCAKRPRVSSWGSFDGAERRMGRLGAPEGSLRPPDAYSSARPRSWSRQAANATLKACS
jgi:hypothetical protein